MTKPVKSFQGFKDTNMSKSENWVKSGLRVMGIVLVMLGIAGFFIAAFSKQEADVKSGSIPGVAFLIIILGIGFVFPQMLKEANGQVSSMRILTFAVTLVFCTLYMKLGWAVGSVKDFKIDDSWIYILGLAFGSKAVQKFGESKNGSGSVGSLTNAYTDTKPVQNTNTDPVPGKGAI